MTKPTFNMNKAVRLAELCPHLYNKHPDGDWYFCDINDKPCPFTDDILACETAQEEREEDG